MFKQTNGADKADRVQHQGAETKLPTKSKTKQTKIEQEIFMVFFKYFYLFQYLLQMKLQCSYYGKYSRTGKKTCIRMQVF